MIIGVLLLVIIAVIVVVASRRRARSLPETARRAAKEPAPLPSSPSHGDRRAADIHPYVSSLLDRWTTAGVLSADSADRIRSFEREAAAQLAVTQKRPERPVPAVAEALGYLGGVLGLAGIVLLIAAYWSDWGRAVQLGVAVGVTSSLVIAGALVRELADPALKRLRWFLWSVATPAMGVVGYVVSAEYFDWDEPVRFWLVIAIGSTILNAALWAGRARPFQEAVFFVSTAVVIGTAIGEPTDARWAGIGVWMTGIAMVAVGLRTRVALAVVPVTVGGLAIVVGSYLTVPEWEGFGFIAVAASSAVMAGLATAKRSPLRSPFDAVLGVIGILGLVQSVPGALVHFAREAGVVTGLVVWSIGCLLILAARWARADIVLLVVGSIAVLVGPAITGTQSLALATLFGLTVSVVFIVFGTAPGRVLLSMFGLAGLLAYVPWTIAHFFPGEGRAPLLITVSGLLIVAVAVVLSRMSGRIRTELGGTALRT